MSYRVIGLSPELFRPYFKLGAEALHKIGARRVEADSSSSFPCRISLEHAQVGEELLLINHEHQSANSPYRASHAIFIRDGLEKAGECVDRLPEVLTSRLLSVRAFDPDGMMLDAEVCEGVHAEALIVKMFKDPKVLYLHAHTARRGCYLARIERVGASAPDLQ